MPPVEQDALIYGPIRVELLTHKVLAQGKFVHLAKMEYRLLCYLILHEGQVLSRQEILTNIWNLPSECKNAHAKICIFILCGRNSAWPIIWKRYYKLGIDYGR